MAEILERAPLTCSGCGLAIATRIICRNLKKPSILVLSTGCLEVTTTLYPYSYFNCPVIHVAFENAAAVASGIFRALKMQGKEKEADVLVLAGDGATFDIGFQALSGMVERGEEVCYICLDNEAYMNTGIQRSGATPLFASTTTTPTGRVSVGKLERKKKISLIMGMHPIAYLATASIAYHRDLVKKLEKALVKKPSFLHILTPCPTGWRFDPQHTVTLSKLAVETNYFPLFEIEDGKLKLNYKFEKRNPISEFLRLQGRFSHLKEEEVQRLQEMVDEDYMQLVQLEEAGEVF